MRKRLNQETTRKACITSVIPADGCVMVVNTVGWVRMPGPRQELADVL